MTPILGIMASQISGHLTPTSPVAGYYAWYDANDAGTITHSSGAVSQWNDKSANGLNLTPPTGFKPTTGTNTMNGKNVLTWSGDGSKRALTVANPAALQGNPNLTWFVVCRLVSGGVDALGIPFAVGEDQYNPVGNITEVYFENGNGHMGIGANQSLIYSNSDYRDINKVYTMRKSSLAIEAWVGSTSIGTTTSPSNWALGSTALAVGFSPQAQSTGNWSFCGRIAEVLIYNSALSAVDRQLNIDYLNNKWGTS